MSVSSLSIADCVVATAKLV